MPQLITALGGIGKTRAAVEYAWRFAGDYSALLKVRGHDLSRLIGDLADLAGPNCLNLELDPAMLPKDKAGRVLDHLRKNPSWLLIIDNVDDEKTAKRIHQFLENLSGGDILITSRWRDWNDEQFQEQKLDLLDIDSATEFIMLAAHKRPKQQSDRDDARQLAQDLGRLSLALHQAVGYINASPNVTIAEYRNRWKTQAKELAGFIREGIYNTDEGGELLTILTTWRTSISQLSTSARWWINHLAFLAPAPVPSALADALHSLDPTPNKTAWNAPGSAVMQLRNYSLLEQPNTPDEGIGQMHRLVQMVLRQELPPEQQAATRLNTAAALKKAFSVDPQEHTNWPRLNPLVDHVSALLEPFTDKFIEKTAADQLDPQGDLAFLGNQCGLMLKGQARYAAAMPMYWLASAIYEKSFGPEHPNMAASLNNLAGLLLATNRLAEAEPMYRRALAIDEKSFGPEHPKVAIRLNNLAELLRATNRLAEAEPMYRQALAIDEKSFGPEHPNVATGLNNLAALLQDTNRLAEAEPMFRRALAIYEKSFGPEHPNVATGLNNLASLLRAINRLAEAEPMFRRSLAIDEKSFGPEHPKVARGLNNLAGLLRATNRLAEAEPLYRRALAIDEKSFGPEHPNVATGLNNLAGLLRATNRLDEAEPMIRRAAVIFIRSLGVGHPNALLVVTNYLDLLSKQGNKPEEIRTEIVNLCNETNTNPQELIRLLGLRLDQSQSTGTDENSMGANS